MQVRLIITLNAAADRGDELVDALRARAADVVTEPGCEQFEVFQSADNPDVLVLLERWRDQRALDAHAELNKTRTPIDPSLIVGHTAREDYIYNRTR